MALALARVAAEPQPPIALGGRAPAAHFSSVVAEAEERAGRREIEESLKEQLADQKAFKMALALRARLTEVRSVRGRSKAMVKRALRR